MANRTLVGIVYVELLVGNVYVELLVGKPLPVGKENVGRESRRNGVEPSVGKLMSVRKGLCRLDLR
jgi:hypothetical protein